MCPKIRMPRSLESRSAARLHKIENLASGKLIIIYQFFETFFFLTRFSFFFFGTPLLGILDKLIG
jgi:hypothetical protein